MAMEDRYDQDALLLHQVDEPLGADDQFAIARQLWIRKAMPTVEVGLQRLRRIDGELGQTASVCLGVSRDEGDCGF